MVSKIFTFGLLAASVYFIYDHNYIVSVLLLIPAVLRLSGYNLQRFAKNLGDIARHSDLEKKCNCGIELTINVEEILKHASVGALFDKLRAKEIIKDRITREQWTKLLIQNYQQKFKNKSSSESVKFNIKNNLVWKNGVIDFNDSVYHEVFIPYHYDVTKDGEEEEEFSIFTSKIEIGLTIRTFLVNGILKLQIGEFSKEFSPDVVKKGLPIYKTHDTVTSFPLMYFSYQHKLPENYLNLSMYATNSYYEHQKGGKADLARDWKETCKEIAEYNYVCSVADEYVEDKRKWDSIIKKFEEKKDAWLKREEFVNPFHRNDDDYYDDLRSDSIYYQNKYLSVFVVNYNDSRERREKYVYTDYYEERP